MPNIAQVLRDELTRVARKEIRAEVVPLRKLLASQRSEIAELKRRNRELEQAVKRNERQLSRLPTEPSLPQEGVKLRFRPAGFAAKRARLGLSAAEVGLLVGASGSAVYLWESGGAKPTAKHMPALAAFRSLGKREATEKLQALKATQP